MSKLYVTHFPHKSNVPPPGDELKGHVAVLREHSSHLMVAKSNPLRSVDASSPRTGCLQRPEAPSRSDSP